ncbi:unnamed protein product [Rhodiola kirilowii]
MGEDDALNAQAFSDTKISEDKMLEPVTGNKENGSEYKETTEDPTDNVASEEKADANNAGDMQLDKHPAKGMDITDEKKNMENIDDLKEELGTENQLNEEGKDSDTAKENGEAHETLQKDLEEETASDRQGDVEGKQDDVVDSKEVSAEVEELEKDAVNEKGLKKPEKGRNGNKKVKHKSQDVQEPKTPAVSSFSIDRPVRERKSVERLVAIIERDSSKDFHIEKGNGSALKDIPNVAYKLSKRKSDDTLKLLHSILFSRRGKAADIKNNISKFSGFVWHGNEEKQKLKIKEKLEKCNKEKLFEFCDILDITVASKATIRKDEVVSMLLEFLVSPHATTDKLLAEKEESSKGNKRKRAEKGTPGSASAKSRKKRAETGKPEEKTNSAETEDESAEDTKENEDGVQDKAPTVPETKVPTEEVPNKSVSEEKLSGPDDQTDEDTKKRKRKRTPKKEEDNDVKTSKKASNSKKTTSGSKTETPGGKTKKIVSLKKNSPSPKETPRNSKQSKVDADKAASPKVSSRKQKEAKPVKEKTVAASKEKVGKGSSKGKDKTVEKQLKLTDENLREETCKILKEVDFNTATFTDIVKILAERFKTDLTPRKADIKMMIQEELTKLTDEESEDDEEDTAHKDETDTTTAQKV